MQNIRKHKASWIIVILIWTNIIKYLKYIHFYFMLNQTHNISKWNWLTYNVNAMLKYIYETTDSKTNFYNI